MTKSFTIAFVPLDAAGHVNPCLGLANLLRQNGHKCVFVVNQTWRKKVESFKFDVKIYVEEHKNGEDGVQLSIDYVKQIGPALKLTPFEMIRAFEAPSMPFFTQEVQNFNNDVQQILDSIKPDALITDTFICVPAVAMAGVPWINLISCNPLYYWTDDRLPPGGAGLPTNSSKKLWQEFRDERVSAYGEDWRRFNQWIQSVGAPALRDTGRLCNTSPFLNIYLCAEELDYEDIAPKDPHRWSRIDSLIRADNQKFELPAKLSERSGKLIYLSMGTMCCSDLSLMKRLVELLSHSEHRFIVSKGPLGDEYELADNMWGENIVPQLQVLQMVDLVLTHGGNNTVTESLHYGTPMLVLPVFTDQYDNAQRIVEKGLGLKLDPYHCTQTELLSAINQLVTDEDLHYKYKQISRRMKSSRSKDNAVQRIQQLLETKD